MVEFWLLIFDHTKNIMLIRRPKMWWRGGNRWCFGGKFKFKIFMQSKGFFDAKIKSISHYWMICVDSKWLRALWFQKKCIKASIDIWISRSSKQIIKTPPIHQKLLKMSKKIFFRYFLRKNVKKIVNFINWNQIS